MSDGKKTALDELLGDPMVQMVMARDSVRPEDLRSLLECKKRRYSAYSGEALPPHMIASAPVRDLCC